MKAPWQQGPLSEWAIVGMNHYHINGERRLFVAMVKHGVCIKEEGPDDEYLWNRLCHQVWRLNDRASQGERDE
jgi:hypothetical protein